MNSTASGSEIQGFPEGKGMVSSASLVRPSGGSVPLADASDPHLGRVPAAVSWELGAGASLEKRGHPLQSWVNWEVAALGQWLQLPECTQVSHFPWISAACFVHHCAICHCTYWWVSESMDFFPVFLCSCVHGLCFGGQWLVQSPHPWYSSRSLSAGQIRDVIGVTREVSPVLS